MTTPPLTEFSHSGPPSVWTGAFAAPIQMTRPQCLRGTENIATAESPYPEFLTLNTPQAAKLRPAKLRAR